MTDQSINEFNLPESELSIEKLITTLRPNKTTTSYKFYWLWSIIEEQFSKESECADISNGIELNYIDLFSSMLSLAWYPVNKYKISLGKQDLLEEKIEKFKNLVGNGLKINSQPETIKERIAVLLSNIDDNSTVKGFNKEVFSLKRNVPYRFLSPWVQYNSSHEHFANSVKKVFHGNPDTGKSDPPVYRWKDNSNDTIIIHPRWARYFSNNKNILISFIKYNLIWYLDRRNPQVPNLTKKIELITNREPFNSVTKRLFDTAIGKIWKKDIFTETLLNEYAIDHYIPFAYLGHNQFWNLNPLAKSINSQKGDSIPDAKYDVLLAGMHHQLIINDYIRQSTKLNNALASVTYDYLDIFDSSPIIKDKGENTDLRERHTILKKLRSHKKEEFKQIYCDYLNKQRLRAQRLGFTNIFD